MYEYTVLGSHILCMNSVLIIVKLVLHLTEGFFCGLCFSSQLHSFVVSLA